MTSVLTSLQEPWVLRTIGSYDDVKPKIMSSTSSIQIVELDGKCMRTVESFYDELAKKLRLPDYFGRNLNALDECVTDLEWIDKNTALVVIIQNTNLMLRNDDELFSGFVDLMMSAGEEWASPIQDGSEWDRPAVPFHLVLHFESPEFVRPVASSLQILEP